jgi:hypothetical protein
VPLLGTPYPAAAQEFELLHGFENPLECPTRPFEDVDGTLYGTSCEGAIFRRTTDGTFHVLHHFSGPDGLFPYNGVIKGIDGAFYGAIRELSTQKGSIQT